MSFNSLKSDMIEMIELSYKIGRYNEILLHHNDMGDKQNFNAEKCDKIKSKINQVEKRFLLLKDKWFRTI